MLNLFVIGLSSEVGVYIVGLKESNCLDLDLKQEQTVSLSHCVRMYEMADPNDPRRVGLTWHPDPILTSEHATTFLVNKILNFRKLHESEDIALKYKAFLTQFRLSKSGLVSAASLSQKTNQVDLSR